MKYFVVLFLFAVPMTLNFAIAFAELEPSGVLLHVQTSSNSYVSGDEVSVRIDTKPNSDVAIDVLDPSDAIIEQFVDTSDEDGHISASFLLPYDVMQGTWKVKATYDLDFATIEFDVVDLQKDRMVMDIKNLERYRPISKPFDYSDHVLVGTVLQKENITENTTRYYIDVDFYLKNEQSFDFITATSEIPEEPPYDAAAARAIQQLNSPFYSEGDTVFVYLKNNGGKYKILPESFVIEKGVRHGAPGIVNVEPSKDTYKQVDNVVFSGIVQKAELYKSAKKDKPFDIILTIRNGTGTEILSKSLSLDYDATYKYTLDTSDLPAGKYEYEITFRGGNSGSLMTREITINTEHSLASPLEQFNLGISFDEIRCKESLVLVQKYDGSPACVKPKSVEKLRERGFWRVPIGSSFHIEKDCNNLDGRIEAQCFKEAFDSCTFAKTNSVIHTIEGDPMYLEAVIRPDCKIHTTFDNTEDRFGGTGVGVFKDTCNDVKLQEYVWVIDDCENMNEFQINYLGQDWESGKKCSVLGGEWNDEFHNCAGLTHDACQQNRGDQTCMSAEQKLHGRDVCVAVCEFGLTDRK